MNYTGERVIPEHMKGNVKTLMHHIARYNFALMYARNKVVLDAACGTGYGTSILDNVANGITGEDINKESIMYALENYGNGSIGWGGCDFDKKWPCESLYGGGSKNDKFDICISFETIEHLNNPDFFLNNVKENCKEFLFSIPINAPSKWHKTVYTTYSARELMEKHFDNITWWNQKGICIHKIKKEEDFNKAKYLIGYTKIV